MSDSGAAARLVVPEGLLVDETVRERLERQLAVAPAAVAGIAAEIADLAPGAGYRVHVEWAALDAPWSAAAAGSRAAKSSPVRGAVLLRPHIGFEIRDGRVEVTEGSVLVDPGAHAHDPHRNFGPLLAASERGKPPFPRRPVVVFLGGEPARDGDWLRRLVNRLVRHDVEARIARPEVAAGVHLTRPCSPSEASIRALSPDVVVTLDGAAAANVDAWLEGDRSTVVVGFDPALPEPMELVSWQIGRAAGRLRARIGPWVDVVAFASLIGRLCAGPHPVPPSDRPQLLEARTPVRERWADGSAAAPTSTTAGCVVVTGATGAPAAARVAGLVDNLEAAGVPVEVTGAASAASVPGAGIVLLAGLAPTPELDAVIAERGRAGLATVVDLGPADLEPAGAADGAPRLSAAAAALADSCGLVVSPAGVLHALAPGAGRRALMMPTLLTRSRAAALRDARFTPEPGALLVIGWKIGAAGDPACAYTEAVARGIALTLEDRRNRVELVGDPDDVPAVLRGLDRVSVVADTADPETPAHWAVHVWTPALAGAEIVDDALAFEEASCAGVASVLPAAAAGGVDGFISPFVLVEQVESAEKWANALHHVLDDPIVREKRREEAQRRADAVDSAAASKAVVSRFAGWARYRQGVRAGA
jgi:hypothetical protein